ncbi:hypothetical protein SCLCIDRAFT_1061956 [Scleroderma citrinum Foug A]|uniref:ATP-dependent DNA helicase n=1 Tax=Scleroderma citrinum Foug A TaxID=1036808 RepID=A0A0C3A231_9AGAM|nr:hypothetical protein SCLCIDRAFT_1061956 [Scleroderma citrinum Foug A]
MLCQIMDFIDDRKRGIVEQITLLERNEQDASFTQRKLGIPMSTSRPSHDFRDLTTKPLASLRLLLSRNHNYKGMFTPKLRSHVEHEEEHDLAVLSQIIDYIDDRIYAIGRQITLVEGIEHALVSFTTNQTRRSALPPAFPQTHIDNEPLPPSPPPPLSTENSISSTATIAPSPSTEVSNGPSTSTGTTFITQNSPLITLDDILIDAEASADNLTVHDSDDRLWKTLEADAPDILMDPPVDMTVRGMGSTSTPSVLGRVDHTASSYYPEVISILKGIFKLAHFRKNQLECITATLDGRDVFYLAPTGGGKSLCYQLPALCKTGKTQGTTFVISPLLSLIEDQVSTLRKKGINAFRLINTADADEAYDAMPRLRKGESLPLVYTTPEKLLSSNNVQDIVVQLHKEKQLARFVVDEAHVIGGWRVWRESYASLGILRKQWPDIPIMALTGSANKSAIEDIKESLALRDPVCLKQSFNRSNLYYKVKKKPSQKKELLKEMAGFIQSHHKDDTGIIYCLSREDCEDVARRLREEFDLSARHFHAGMDRDTKRINQEDWSNGRCKIIVATIAFGMGIDKPDVRFVIHATMSKDMDGYYQETGRAGRDGKPSDCILFYAYSDAMKIQNMLKNPHDQNNKPPPDELERQLERLSAVVAYASNESDCRRVTLLRHFDETFDEAECHKHCDNCCKPGTVVHENHTETSQQAIQLLRDMSNVSRERGIPLTLFKDVWRGKKGATVSAFTGLPGYAAATRLDHRMIDRIVTQLLYSNIFATRRTTSGNGFGNNYLEVSDSLPLSQISVYPSDSWAVMLKIVELGECRSLSAIKELTTCRGRLNRHRQHQQRNHGQVARNL